MLELTLRFVRQIIPPVVATLVAAVMIAAFNKTFSGHLVQPRMAALDSAAAEQAPAAPQTATQPTAQPATSVVAMNKPAAQPAGAAQQTGPVTEYITIEETADGPERIWDKDSMPEATKDQATVKTAVATPPARPAAAPKPAPAVQAAAPMPQALPLPEPRRGVSQVELLPPPHRAAPLPSGAPYSTAAPYPPVVVASPTAIPPVVYEQQPVVIAAPPQSRPVVVEADRDDLPPRPPRGVLGTIVETLKPSNLIERGRQLGDQIEAAGNEILPTIRH